MLDENSAGTASRFARTNRMCRRESHRRITAVSASAAIKTAVNHCIETKTVVRQCHSTQRSTETRHGAGPEQPPLAGDASDRTRTGPGPHDGERHRGHRYIVEHRL